MSLNRYSLIFTALHHHEIETSKIESEDEVWPVSLSTNALNFCSVEVCSILILSLYDHERTRTHNGCIACLKPLYLEATDFEVVKKEFGQLVHTGRTRTMGNVLSLSISVCLSVSLSVSLSLSLSLSHTHTHAHTPLSHHVMFWGGGHVSFIAQTNKRISGECWFSLSWLSTNTHHIRSQRWLSR